MPNITADHFSSNLLKHKGRPIPENDIWIAAQCLERGWRLATNDEHFSYVDNLIMEQW
ncbi:MAG: PIN domain-containing protein [Nostoc sp.]|uniref:PIN domain-containing protein n=1 Tax=Nostoc sp. TaxID=1180 RepID=UPI002FF7759E